MKGEACNVLSDCSKLLYIINCSSVHEVVAYTGTITAEHMHNIAAMNQVYCMPFRMCIICNDYGIHL